MPEIAVGHNCWIDIDATSSRDKLEMGKATLSRYEARIVSFEPDNGSSVHGEPERGIAAAVYLKRVEANPRRKAALARARVRAGESSSTRLSPLARLRMRAGMSQKGLAAAMKTSQPSIARLERQADSANMTLDRMENLAKALGCDIMDVVTAAREQRTANQKFIDTCEVKALYEFA